MLLRSGGCPTKIFDKLAKMWMLWVINYLSKVCNRCLNNKLVYRRKA